MKQSVLTKIPGTLGHVKTNITIQWDGVSQEEIMLLARARICQRLQETWIRDRKIPKEVEVSAKDFVQPEGTPIDFTRYTHEKINRKLQRLIDGMSTLDKQELIRQFSGDANKECSNFEQ